MAGLPCLKKFFQDKTIFVTGGTGFVGKALIEKILRSCSDVKTIYMLIRPKKGKDCFSRKEDVLKNAIFDLLREKNPELLNKIVPIRGDVAELNLGISDEDRIKLIQEVDIFFNVSASVKFDDFLKYAIFTNIRSAREAAILALEMKNLQVFMHVSTTYCNINNRKIVEEKLYPQEGNWREAISIAETSDSHILSILTPQYLGDFPNTYTYTKQLAEHCINDLLLGKVKTIIFRPSIVISALTEPFTGWIDNFNGPVGLLIAGGAGILRTVYGNTSADADYISVDHIAKLMLVATWYKATNGNINNLSVYHGSKYDRLTVTLGELVEMGKSLYWDVPLETKIWFPGNSMTKCWYNYYANVLLFHLIPAMLIDFMLKITGHKPFMFRIQRKIYIGNMAISHFMLNDWQFVNTEASKLFDLMNEKDKVEFDFMLQPKNPKEVYDYYLRSTNQARILLLKESKVISDGNKTKTKIMYYLDVFVKSCFTIWVFWMVFFKFRILHVFVTILYNYWNSL